MNQATENRIMQEFVQMWLYRMTPAEREELREEYADQPGTLGWCELRWKAIDERELRELRGVRDATPEQLADEIDAEASGQVAR